MSDPKWPQSFSHKLIKINKFHDLIISLLNKKPIFIFMVSYFSSRVQKRENLIFFQSVTEHVFATMGIVKTSVLAKPPALTAVLVISRALFVKSVRLPNASDSLISLKEWFQIKNVIQIFLNYITFNQFGHKWCRHRLDRNKKTEKTRDFEKLVSEIW